MNKNPSILTAAKRSSAFIWSVLVMLAVAIAVTFTSTASAADKPSSEDPVAAVLAAQADIAALNAEARKTHADNTALRAKLAKAEAQLATAMSDLATCQRRKEKECPASAATVSTASAKDGTPKVPQIITICDEGSGAKKQDRKGGGFDCVCKAKPVDDDPFAAEAPLPLEPYFLASTPNWATNTVTMRCATSQKTTEAIQARVNALMAKVKNAATKAELASLQAEIDRLKAGKASQAELDRLTIRVGALETELKTIHDKVDALAKDVDDVKGRLLALVLGAGCTGQYRGSGMGGLYGCGAGLGFRTNPTGDGVHIFVFGGAGQYAAFQNTPTFAVSVVGLYEWRLNSLIEIGVGAKISGSGAFNAPTDSRIKYEDRRSLEAGPLGSLRIGGPTFGGRLQIGGVGGRSTFTKENGRLGDAAFGAPVLDLIFEGRL